MDLSQICSSLKSDDFRLLEKSMICLVLFVIFFKPINTVLSYLLKCVRFFTSPMNYELDMTTDQYCKNVIEVDNSLVATKPKFRDLEDLVDNTVNELKSKQVLNQQYPNGWLPVIESTKVSKGQVMRAIIIGRDVIVSRSFDGHVSVLDAYCPHMGVHIGIGGKIVQADGTSCVKCPFHGWTYRLDNGQCVHIPYMKQGSSSQIPKQAKLNTWPCCEVDNFIYIWHHIDGLPPSWQIEPAPELSSNDWTLAGRSSHKSCLDSGDMLENGADMHHFEGIHNDLFVFGGELMKVQAFSHLQKYTRHCWDPSWEPILDENGNATHKASVRLDSWISFFGFNVFFIQVRATQIGPASVTLRYNSNWYGPGIIKMDAIRLGGRQTMYVQHVYTKNRIFNCIMAKAVLYGEVKQLERDLLMWNHRKYLKNPVLIPEDKIIKKFRHWYAQFYRRRPRISAGD